MHIAEIFHSIQGEGQYAGTPSVFVRTSGCNLRCWFCDTAYTSWEPEGEQRSWEDVLAQVRGYQCAHVVITGGEPLLQSNVIPLTKALRFSKHHVTIETAGTVYLPVHADLMSISPKRPNSTPRPGGPVPSGMSREVSGRELEQWTVRHERTRDNPDAVSRLIDEFPYQFKFVIDRREDLEDVEGYLARFAAVPADNVWLMPQGVTAEELAAKAGWVEELAVARGYRYSPRLHIELFGNVRGK
jgi:7-carboxy-7-deazaguanine synthase